MKERENLPAHFIVCLWLFVGWPWLVNGKDDEGLFFFTVICLAFKNMSGTGREILSL